MIAAKARKWGGSFGLLVSRKDMELLSIKEGEEVLVEVVRKGNPLKELWGSARKRTKTTEQILKEVREELKAD
ncbi:hypothetical protein HYY74_01345 [Candidatus Woesearchaeota archaeon]|nr:hypothetical protein [Candidatus Woesearchaeota archaeon]